MLSESCTLRIATWDVDFGDGERDRVLFNGERVEILDPANPAYLSGSNGAWTINRYSIPMRKVRFPSAVGVNGQPPQPAINTVNIEIDTSLIDPERWCTTVDWCELRIGWIMSPIVLVHGNGSSPDYFDRFNFTGHFQQQHTVVDNTLLLPAGSIEGNAAVLRDHLNRRAAEYGADSLHLVAHSKGGLDSRGYISLYRVPTLAILSLATLATPHDGSVAADLAVAVKTAFAANARFVPPPSAQWPAIVAGLLPESPGWNALQTESVAQFNVKTREHLIRSKAVLFAAGADADLNADAQFTTSEATGFIAETPELSNPIVGPFVRIFLTQQWQLLRGAQRLETSLEFDTAGQLVLRAIEVPVVTLRPNDLLVTIPSALGQGPGSIALLLRTARSFTGAAGFDHYLICGPATSQLTLSDLIVSERTAGDLRNN